MPELPTPHAMTELRWLAWAALCTLPLCAVAPHAWAQGVPAALRACAADSDPGRRLDCYDRQMKRLSRQPPPAAHARSAPAAARPQPAETGSAAALPGPTARPAGQSMPQTAAATAKPAAGAPAAPRHAPWKIFAGGASSRVTSRIASLDRWPDAMVLHLDNGQVWRQIGRASGDLGLRTGDTVTIEKHFGSYWLSSRHVSDMQVRQEQP